MSHQFFFFLLLKSVLFCDVDPKCCFNFIADGEGALSEDFFNDL